MDGVLSRENILPLEQEDSSLDSLSLPRPGRHISNSSIRSRDSGYETGSLSNLAAQTISDLDNKTHLSSLPRPETCKTKHPAKLQCYLCPKQFCVVYNLHRHLRTHSGNDPFICSFCEEAFAWKHDKTRHERLHRAEKKYFCKGNLNSGLIWGCGRGFARAETLCRHFRSEAGRVCIQPLRDEDANSSITRQPVPGSGASGDDESAQNLGRSETGEHVVMVDKHAIPSPNPGAYPFTLLVALRQQYPALGVIWESLLTECVDEGVEGDISGRSSFDRSTEGEFWENDYAIPATSTADLFVMDAPETGELRNSSHPITTEEHYREHCTEGTRETTNSDNSPVSLCEGNDAQTDNSIAYKGQLAISQPDPVKESPRVPDPARNSDSQDAKHDTENTLGDKTMIFTPKAVFKGGSTLSHVAGGSASSVSTPMPLVNDCPTPSTVLDDMTETEDDISTTETSFSSRASSTSMWPGTPNQAEREGIVAPILDVSRRRIVDRLMQEACLLLDQHAFRSRAGSTESSDYQSFSERPSGESGESSNDTRKHSRDNESGSEMPGDGSGDNGPFKRRRVNATAAGHQPRKLACPYYQRNSQRHKKYRSCAGPGWISCHRVKEHLYRRHMLPIRCVRCYTTFKTDKELSDHHRQLEGCKIQHTEPFEGFDKDQERQLRSRKKLTASEEERWKEMFRILFPDDEEDTIPSPYYDTDVDLLKQSDQLAEYERFMARELPRMLRTRLEATVLGASEPLESQIRSQLVDMVRSCQSELFRTYPQHRHTQTPSMGRNLDPSSPIHSLALLDAPPTGLSPDISAWYMPPSVLDTNLHPPYQELLHGSAALCPTVEFSSFSESGYASQSFSFPNDLNIFGRTDTNAGTQTNADRDAVPETLDFESTTVDTGEKDALFDSLEEPWSCFNNSVQRQHNT